MNKKAGVRAELLEGGYAAWLAQNRISTGKKGMIEEKFHYLTFQQFQEEAASGGPNPPNQNLSVSNAVGGALNWSVNADATWLGLNPGSGADSGNVTVSVDIAELSLGTYNATITVTAADATNSPVTIPVTLKETLLGDLNGDGLVDLKDAILALKVIYGKDPNNPNDPYVIRQDYVTSGVDIGGDKRIGLEELLYILQKTGGIR